MQYNIANILANLSSFINSIFFAEIPKISHSSQDTPLLPPITSEEESNDMLNLLCLNEPEALVRMNQRDSGVKPYSYLDLIDALKQAQNR